MSRVATIASATLAPAILALFVSLATPSASWAMPGAGGGKGGMHHAYGQPLLASDLPVGMVTVKVVGKGVADKRVGVAVTLVPEGGGAEAAKIVKYTGADGRARFAGLTPGKRYQALLGAKGVEQRSAVFGIPKGGGVRLLMSGGSAPAGAHGTGPKSAKGSISAAKAGGKASVSRKPTRDRKTLGLAGGTHLRGQVGKGGLSFMQVFELLNRGQAPIDPGPEGIVLPAPEGAVGLAVGRNEEALAQVAKDGRSVRITGLIKPGKTRLHITFKLLTDGPRLDYRQRMGLPMGYSLVAIMNNNDLSMIGPRYQRHEMRGETKVFLFRPVKAGGSFEFTLSDIPYHDPTLRNLTLVAAALLLIWALLSSVGARARREGRQRMRDELLERLVDLAERDATSSGRDDAKQREKLLAELRPIWRD